MSARRDLANLLKHVRSQRGWDVTLGRNGHYKITHNGHLKVVTGSTPSDGRALKNFVGDLRRAGVPGL